MESALKWTNHKLKGIFPLTINDWSHRGKLIIYYKVLWVESIVKWQNQHQNSVNFTRLIRYLVSLEIFYFRTLTFTSFRIEGKKKTSLTKFCECRMAILHDITVLSKTGFISQLQSSQYNGYNQLQKYLRHCTVFWLKWPVHDLVLVTPLHPFSKLLAIQDHAQNLEEQLWMGGRREVSILSHRPVTSSDSKQEWLFFVRVSQHFCNWL